MFWKGTDESVRHVWFLGAQWHGPAEVPGAPLGSSPEALGQANGTVDVFWQGKDRNLWHSWFLGGAWHGPAPLTSY